MEPVNEKCHLHCAIAIASRKVTRVFFDYDCAGSYEEKTLRENVDDLQKIKLRRRVLVDMIGRDLTTTALGEKISLPIALAPGALAGLQYGNGEILAVRAAHEAGIPFMLSPAVWLLVQHGMIRQDAANGALQVVGEKAHADELARNNLDVAANLLAPFEVWRWEATGSTTNVRR